ncbi:cell envelope biogenesis protein TonB [Bacteroidia bacterium]|nr:cell envelope biogenesis protein TonB [Bacteroidia bacterium]
MKVTKEEIYGFIGSCIFCSLLFLILYFTVLRTEVKAGEEGVLVSFGTVDMSSGAFEPNRGAPKSETETPTPVPVEPTPVKPPVPKPETQQNVQQKPQAQPNTPPITQNIEQTAAIEAAKQKQLEQDRIAAEQKAAQAKAAEEQRKRDAINQQVSGAFGSATGNPAQSGTGQSGTGIQGNPQSTSGAGSPNGSGGYGEFNLGGRTLGPGGLPRPVYSIQDEGRIVINITVDPKGNVIFAEISLKGTNIDNNNMRNSALEAARKAKFNNISGNNNQSGTITYKYSLK